MRPMNWVNIDWDDDDNMPQNCDPEQWKQIVKDRKKEIQELRDAEKVLEKEKQDQESIR